MKTAEKTVNAIFGAPVVAYRRLSEAGHKFVGVATSEFDAWAKEGTKVRKQINKNPIVSEINTRVDLDNVSDRVGKLRHQIEDTLGTWREGFRPEKSKAAKTTKKSPAKSVAKKATAKKPTTTTKARKVEVEADETADV